MRTWIKTAAVVLAEILILIPIILLVTRQQKGNEVDSDRISLVNENDPLGVYADTLNVSVGQMVSATRYAQGESASKNVIYDAYKEIMNINFTAQFSANIGEAYSYQLGMAAISNDLPDLFFCGQNELNDLIAQDMVEDLTDVYYEYASPELRLALEYNYTGDVSMWNNGNPEAKGLTKTNLVLDTVSKDGKIYGFPFISDLFNFCPLVWIRTDWLAKYAEHKGITYTDISEVMPKDFQEYIDIVYYFSNANLHNGGKSYGVSFGFDGAGLQGISNVYGAYPETFVKGEDGKMTYGTNAPEFKEAMKMYNQLYRDGCIDPGSALDGQLLKQALAAGKIGSFIGEYWSIMWGVADATMNNPNCDWLPWAVRDYDGNVITPMVPANVTDNSCYSIRKGFSNPEVVIIIANHLIDRFFNDEGEWNKRMVEIRLDPKYRAVRDEVEMYSPVRLDAPNKNTRYAFDIQHAIKTGETDHLSLDCSEVYQTIKAYLDDPLGEGKPFYSLYKVFGPTGAYKELMNYAEYDYEKDKNLLKVNFLRPGYGGMYTEEMLSYMGIIKDAVGMSLVNLYTGEKAFTDTDWDNFVKMIGDKGMTEILQSLNG